MKNSFTVNLCAFFMFFHVFFLSARYERTIARKKIKTNQIQLPGLSCEGKIGPSNSGVKNHNIIINSFELT